MSPRLCILTQYFPPEMGAPQGRLSELGERLIDLGWEVEALTALPNYPTGSIFPGYSPFEHRIETIGRIRAVRVPLFASKHGFAKRMASYFSFVAAACALGPRLCNRPDLIFVESPPLFIGYAARFLARHWQCPFVFNVSDLWPESAIRMGVIKPGLATRLAESLELALYRDAAGVTGQSSEIISSVRTRVPSAVTALITNGVDPNRFSHPPDEHARTLVGEGPVFTFAGLLGYAQGIEQILDLAKALPSSVPAKFVLVGEGPVKEAVAARIEQEHITRVRLVPAQPRDRIPAILGASDVALITLGATIPGAVPSKIYEAMAASLPILLIAEGEPVRRVLDAGAGIAVTPGDTAAAVTAITRLATDPTLRNELGGNGRKAAETIYNRDVIGRQLDRFLRELV